MKQVFLNDLLPIFVLLVFGYLAGARNRFTEDNALAFNKLVLNYALPAALFVSIVKTDRAMLFSDITLTIVSTLILLIGFAISFFSCLILFKHNKQESSVAAMITGSPTVGVLGFAILDPVYGAGATTGIVVAIVAIIQHVAIIPLGIYLFHPSDENGNKKHTNPVVAAIKEPIVIVPMIAITLVILGINFPTALDPSLNLIAYTKSGVAIFAAGITLSVYKLQLGKEVIYNTFLKLFLMPFIALLLGIIFNLQKELIQMLVLISALPSSISGVIVGGRYQTYLKIGTSSLAFSILFFALAAPFWIMFTGPFIDYFH